MTSPPTPVTVTLAQICDAIETTLSTATGLSVHQSYDELTENIADHATLQVYPESGNTDVWTSNDRTTHQRGVAVTEFIFHADLYAQQRINIGEDMAALLPLVDAIITRLEAQKTGALFGLTVSGVDVIKAFKWSWSRVVFEYAAVKYMGARFVITIRVF